MEYDDKYEYTTWANLYADNEVVNRCPPYVDHKKQTEDKVNHPSHYIHDGLETIDVIKAWCGDGYRGYLEGNIIKYISRWKDKNGIEDLKKALWYLNKLIEEQESL